MMPRAKTPEQRAADVRAAVDDLPAAYDRAMFALNRYGAADARTLAAWEVVELHGATVHRQARLLAGKSRGG